MSRMTGNSVDKTALQNHSAIKDELKKTEVKRRMSRMAGANLTMDQINVKKDMKEELAQAAIKNKVNAMAAAPVSAQMIAQKNLIKAALEKAIYEKMVAKTRSVTGNPTLHKADIDSKKAITAQLITSQREQEKAIQNKDVLPNSIQKQVSEKLEKQQAKRRMSNFAGTQLNEDQLQAKQDIKKALQEVQIQKTIAAMEEQIALEAQQNN